jgi:hypothetical protein
MRITSLHQRRFRQIIIINLAVTNIVSCKDDLVSIPCRQLPIFSQPPRERGMAVRVTGVREREWTVRWEGRIVAIYISSPKVRRVPNTPASYSGVPGFEYRPGKWIWRLNFAIFLSCTRLILGGYIKTTVHSHEGNVSPYFMLKEWRDNLES